MAIASKGNEAQPVARREFQTVAVRGTLGQRDATRSHLYIRLGPTRAGGRVRALGRPRTTNASASAGERAIEQVQDTDAQQSRREQPDRASVGRHLLAPSTKYYQFR